MEFLNENKDSETRIWRKKRHSKMNIRERKNDLKAYFSDKNAYGR